LAISLDALLINLILNVIVPTIILSPFLWLAGRAIVGKEKAKFTDAIWIVLIGTVFGSIFGAIFSGIIASLIQLIVWLALVKHFFDCGWIRALVISIAAVIIFVVVVVILGLLGFGIWAIGSGIWGTAI